MAKKKESDDQSPEEKQLPEKPKSKSSGISLPIMIGVIAGIVILTVVLIIVLIKVFIIPSLISTQQMGQNTTTQSEKVESKESKGEKSDEEYDETKITEEDEKATIYQETGRITTNPKGSSTYFVINLGLMFLPRDKEVKEQLSKELEKSMTWRKVLAGIKDNVTVTIDRYSIEDLKTMKRDSLKSMFLQELKPIFRKEKIYLRNVLLQEFIIQE